MKQGEYLVQLAPGMILQQGIQPVSTLSLGKRVSDVTFIALEMTDFLYEFKQQSLRELKIIDFATRTQY